MIVRTRFLLQAKINGDHANGGRDPTRRPAPPCRNASVRADSDGEGVLMAGDGSGSLPESAPCAAYSNEGPAVRVRLIS